MQSFNSIRSNMHAHACGVWWSKREKLVDAPFTVRLIQQRHRDVLLSNASHWHMDTSIYICRLYYNHMIKIYARQPCGCIIYGRKRCWRECDRSIGVCELRDRNETEEDATISLKCCGTRLIRNVWNVGGLNGPEHQQLDVGRWTFASHCCDIVDRIECSNLFVFSRGRMFVLRRRVTVGRRVKVWTFCMLLMIN